MPQAKPHFYLGAAIAFVLWLSLLGIILAMELTMKSSSAIQKRNDRMHVMFERARMGEWQWAANRATERRTRLNGKAAARRAAAWNKANGHG